MSVLTIDTHAPTKTMRLMIVQFVVLSLAVLTGSPPLPAAEATPPGGAVVIYSKDNAPARQEVAWDSGVKPVSVLTFDTGFRRFRAQRFGPRQCRQDSGGVAGQQRRDGQLEAKAAAAHGSGKTGFPFSHCSAVQEVW